MDINAMKLALEAMEKHLKEAGWRRPRGIFFVRGSSSDSIYITMNNPHSDEGESVHSSVLGDEEDVEGCIARAWAKIEELPSPVEQAREDFVTALTRLAEQAKVLGVEDEMYDTLKDRLLGIAKDLAENCLPTGRSKHLIQEAEGQAS